MLARHSPAARTLIDAEGQVHDAFSDPELRYRMRYVDLVVNKEVRDVFILRTKMVNAMREFFNDRGYLEVETPILQTSGGAAARPFVTHRQCAGYSPVLAHRQ